MYKECPICGDHGSRSIAVLDGLPVFCNIQYPSRQEALEQGTGIIDLHYCPTCEHFFNAAFDPALVQYQEAYENSLHFSPTFSTYASELAQGLVDRYGIKSSQVIDIGCGKGDFLKLVCALGANEGYGFDPSYDPARDEEPPPANVQFHAKPFQGDNSLNPRLVSCRQVLEHIEQPVQFLSDIVAGLHAASDPVLYLEVPNALFTVRNLGIWDLIYEHCQYFTARSFSELAQRAGLTPVRVYECFGEQYLSLEATRPSGEARASAASCGEADCEHLAEEFQGRLSELLDSWQKQLDELAEKGPVVIWGAGSKGVTFANLMKPAERIAVLTDINPHKQGRFIAGTGHKIIGPNELAALRPASVLVMNPLYESEIKTQITALGIDANVIAIS